MQAYLIRRVLLVIPTVLVVTLIVFLLIRLIPGDIIDRMAAEQAAYSSVPVDREGLKKLLGLDAPIYVQYGRWLSGLVQGDIGKSLWTNRPVIDEIKSSLPISLELGILAIIIGQAVAIPIGILSAVRQDTKRDYISRSVAIIFLCVPNFWIATLVMVYPSIWWHWAPSMEYIPITQDFGRNMLMFLLPALIMGLHASGSTMRMMRTMMLEVLRHDYIRTAWSKGLRERVVIVRHAMRNALIPVITMIGTSIPIVISGTVIIEQIFNLPGMGRLMLDALTTRDYTVVSGVNMFIALFVLATNLVVDVSYSFLDPRVRYR